MWGVRCRMGLALNAGPESLSVVSLPAFLSDHP